MMNNKIKITAIVMFVFCVTIFGQEQETKVTKDLELWTGAGVSKKINKHWKLSLDQEFRFLNDMTEFDTWFTDFGVGYKLNKHIRFGLNYRFYQVKEDENLFETKHRLSVDFKFKYKIDRFTLKYRLRAQNKDEDFLTDETGKNNVNLRNKLSVGYDIKSCKAEPFFDVELYRRIYDVNTSNLSKLRWTIGVEYPVHKKGDVKLFYRLDNELNETYPKDTYIVGLGYTFSF